MSVEVTLFTNVRGFRGLLTSAGLASSQVCCVTTLLAPFPLIRGSHDLSGSGSNTVQ